MFSGDLYVKKFLLFKLKMGEMVRDALKINFGFNCMQYRARVYGTIANNKPVVPEKYFDSGIGSKPKPGKKKKAKQWHERN
ncbi:hypothetical protein BpHYR1_002616 [Brachionus plicatilis]|uniref:Uncharacterized protein n=1 Tax=Brachionus plicatilis TaxID=10195 RepID=A0A3M7S026_BRAPC|nr:hypothetical protein BpHYR1_002616 [Brachionus plicatilis]